ncbi:30S ribosomal protein S6 [bacterium]|nr:30S ribosomal protein S6 [bacterium]
MKTYELVLIFDPNIEPDQVEADIRRIHDTVVGQGGKFRRWERWGKRRLAYEIRHRQYGLYILTVYDIAPEATHELDRVLHLTTSLMRSLVTVVEPERVPDFDAESVASLGVSKEVAAPAEITEVVPVEEIDAIEEVIELEDETGEDQTA